MKKVLNKIHDMHQDEEVLNYHTQMINKEKPKEEKINEKGQQIKELQKI